jgi:hypothetical protein
VKGLRALAKILLCRTAASRTFSKLISRFFEICRLARRRHPGGGAVRDSDLKISSA